MVSIIVPVHNCAKYLRGCIDSILRQTYQDYEIIIVDDGSTDDSSNICDEYVQKHHFIKVIHKKNGGVSSARNIGIQKAKGQKIIFIDADDIISSTFLEKLTLPFKKGNIDLSLIGYNHINDNGKRLYGRGYDDKIRTINDYVENCFLQGSSCMYLFDVCTIKNNNIQFNENLILSEDRLFVLENLICSKTIATLKDEGYSYRDNTSSATRTKLTIKKVEARYKAIEAILNLTKKYTLTNEQKKIISAFMPYMLNDYMYALSEINDKELTKEGQKKFRDYFRFMKAEGIQGFEDAKLKGCVRNLRLMLTFIKLKQLISNILH